MLGLLYVVWNNFNKEKIIVKDEIEFYGWIFFVFLDLFGKFYLVYCYRCLRLNLLMCISIIMF